MIEIPKEVMRNSREMRSVGLVVTSNPRYETCERDTCVKIPKYPEDPDEN